MTPTDSAARSFRTIREEPVAGPIPVFVHAEWRDRFPWLVQGMTGRGAEGPAFDLALFGQGSPRAVQDRWEALAQATGMPRLVHGRQVHGPAVRLHADGPPGLYVAPATDGHATRAAGVLLTIGTADCVPIYLVDPEKRVVAALHGGWRGVVAGILERGLEVLADRLACGPGDLHLHLGPAICGACYEVGPEVHRALGRDDPNGPAPVDLRAVLAERARAAGIDPERITVSAFCTRCGDGERVEAADAVLPFFSHRGGDHGRQMAFLGVRG